MTKTQIDQLMTDQMVQQAIVSCAKDRFDGNVQGTLQALRQGRCEICCVYTDHLISHLGNFIGDVDRTVKAVYKIKPYSIDSNTGSEDFKHQKAGINMVAWVERKNPALQTLGVTLEKVLSRSQKKLGCKNATEVCHSLDLRMVDDQDIHDQRGFGLMANNQIVHSKVIWERQGTKEGSPDKLIGGQIELPTIEHEFLDPELTPEDLIIKRALEIQRTPLKDQVSQEHYLTSAKVALIRRIISDQKDYIEVAKRWFTVSDLADIYKRRISNGRIGGKSAGMLLAARILNEVADQDLKDSIHIPESYYVGSDLIYIFMAMNGLMHWKDQKYKSEELIYAEYSQIKTEFLAGKFPPENIDEFAHVLEQLGPKPIIVRSSSQLEDNFGTSFAGKYNSYFCPNRGSPQENLEALTQAIARIYASTLKPEALLYRRSKDLQDYDERMAILIQSVQGEAFGQYYLPHGAGVAFSRNLYCWSPEINPEDGFARIVWGLGTRAVERKGDDYPRLVALKHPTFQPDDSTDAIRRYSQRYVDVIDLKENRFKSLPILDVLTPRYPALRQIMQIEKEGFFITPRMRVVHNEMPNLAITFDEMLRRTRFSSQLSKILCLLEENYHNAVDVEFTIHLQEPNSIQPRAKISLLQCRPQSHLLDTQTVQIPEHLPQEDIIFSTHFMVPLGYLSDIRFVIYVSPEMYFSLPTPEARREIGRVISRLNVRLGEKQFICIGPGRWGSTDTDLGVFVSYADIHNAGALVELSGQGVGPNPEPSLGTHFFHDLMEAQIYPLAISTDEEETIFNHEFFNQTKNSLAEWHEVEAPITECLRLIDVDAFRPGHHIEVIMDNVRRQATAFLVSND